MGRLEPHVWRMREQFTAAFARARVEQWVWDLSPVRSLGSYIEMTAQPVAFACLKRIPVEVVFVYHHPPQVMERGVDFLAYYSPGRAVLWAEVQIVS